MAHMVCCAAWSAICDYHAGFLTDIAGDVSGLMLLQQTTFVNLIEATPDVIHALLRHLQAEADAPEGCVSSIRCAPRPCLRCGVCRPCPRDVTMRC
jgi:hypothetical protein